MTKTVTHFGGASPVTTFTATVKSNYAPEIVESYIDDRGDIQHILTNGNTLSENNFVKHWGKPKGIINWKAKAANPDTTKSHYK